MKNVENVEMSMWGGGICDHLNAIYNKHIDAIYKYRQKIRTRHKSGLKGIFRRQLMMYS